MIPDKLILLFGNGDSNYIDFACKTFRIYLMLVICNGIQIPSGIFFQAIGKSSRSAILSLSRQILFLLPAMFILSNLFGLIGVLFAGPVADGIAFLLSTTFLLLEVRQLSGETVKKKSNVEAKETEKMKKEPIIISISREYGSGGRYVGELVAQKLGIKLYDKEFIVKVAEETGLAEEYIENNEQKRKVLDAIHSGYYAGLSNADELFIKEANIIKKLAKEESCVIIGRCANYILKDNPHVVKVFIYSSMEDKVKRATKYYGLSKEKAKNQINKINKLRANHYKYYTEQDWADPENYDLCLNSDALGVEKTAEIITDFLKKK